MVLELIEHDPSDLVHTHRTSRTCTGNFMNNTDISAISTSLTLAIHYLLSINHRLLIKNTIFHILFLLSTEFVIWKFSTLLWIVRLQGTLDMEYFYQHFLWLVSMTSNYVTVFGVKISVKLFVKMHQTMYLFYVHTIQAITILLFFKNLITRSFLIVTNSNIWLCTETYFICWHFPCFFINSKLSALLVWLLDNRILHLSIHTFIFISCMNLRKRQ
jgi:hypothetical protein